MVAAGACMWLASAPVVAETAPPPAEILLDLWATGGDHEIGAEASASDTEVSPGWDGPGSGAAAAEDADSSEPYLDFTVVGDHTVTCDADDGCPQAIEDIAEEEEITAVEVEALILQAFQSLPVAPSPISYQPDGDWAAVNMDFIVYTDTTEQVLGTTILDVPVSFRLTPSHWTWNFGDGSPAVPSSNPGAAYPNHTISHVYSSATEGISITLTTLWSGQFQIADTGDWYPVNGFVTTTATAGPVEIVAFDVHLVP